MKYVTFLKRLLPSRSNEDREHNNKILQFINRYKFISLLIGSIFIALSLTIISVSLYVVTGTSKLDLSRPGYESARRTINTENDEVGDSYVLGRTFDKSTLTQFIAQYKKRSAGLKYYDVFDPKLIEDTQLGLISTDTNQDPLLPLPE